MLSKYRIYRYDQMDAPAVTAGTNAVLLGARSGLFPEMGLAVPGEMGGLWAGEKKVCDGFFFAVDDVPLLIADACEQNPVETAFHYRMQPEELHVVRRQMIPDGVKGCVIELEVENLRNAPRMVEVSFTVRTEILTVASSRGTDGMELGRDVGEYDEKAQAFFARDSRNPWHAAWGAEKTCRALQADLPASVYGFGNTPGKGINGRIFYRIRVNAHQQATLRLFVVGGYASRSQAEEALELLRERSCEMIEEKIARIGSLMEESAATLPDERLERCWNWSRIYGDWMTRCLPGGGMGLCTDLPEHPSLFGKGFSRAMAALLPLGGGVRVQEMLRTMVRLSEDAQLAPGRLAKRISRSSRILQVGGVKESAQFVALVHRVLKWTGDRAFAEEMLPMTGLCINYLRRSTRNFEDIRQDILKETALALAGQAYILQMTGADAGEMLAILEKLPPMEAESITAASPLHTLAAWHGKQAHVEQMIGCLGRMAQEGEEALPGAIKCYDPGVLLASRSAGGFIWPMTDNLFGMKPDAASKTIAFAPHTPIGWDGWALDNVAIGSAKVSLKSERVSPSRCRYTVTVSDPGWHVILMENGAAVAHAVEGELALEMGD